MRRGIIAIAVVLVVGAIATAAVSQKPWLPRSDVVQPIPFSHRIHAGLHHIPCQYCHEYARRSPTAGVPPVQRCIGCHGTLAQRGALTPVTRPWTDRKRSPLEIRWNRVYKLPDFVRFAHYPHIHAGIACQSCHGPVENMDRVVPVYEINMGFCLNCHAQKKASLDCVTCHY